MVLVRLFCWYPCACHSLAAFKSISQALQHLHILTYTAVIIAHSEAVLMDKESAKVRHRQQHFCGAIQLIMSPQIAISTKHQFGVFGAKPEFASKLRLAAGHCD
jgi:hypothetical protein